ncbi:MAG TPA: alpha/beta fold hydrolase [Steroidobacteraceae bacterium]|jgi:pimeloyl-ACP methyl ester carboxylesterase
MNQSLPILLIPGLLATPRLYAAQIPELWRHGPVTIADHTRHVTVAEVARDILASAPAEFALAGLSMGGYIAFEILRQAPQRIRRLALLDTSAREDRPEQGQLRRAQIELAQTGHFAEIPEKILPQLLHDANNPELRRVVLQMAEETGAEAFVHQQNINISRPDSRPSLAAIACPTLVVVGANDKLTPPIYAEEIAASIRGARLATIPECGHLSTLERPEAVTRALVEWLSM